MNGAVDHVQLARLHSGGSRTTHMQWVQICEGGWHSGSLVSYDRVCQKEAAFKATRVCVRRTGKLGRDTDPDSILSPELWPFQ
jgi:hypothetical protein